MRIIHCTKKLLKELGDPSLQNPDTLVTGLGNWYCNLLRIDRKKCLLFTNEKTLYSFLIPRVKKENLRNIVDEFLFNLNMNLQAEGFALEIINKVMAEYKDIGFAKTGSKNVLGAMTQLAFESEYLILHRYKGIEKVRILEVNKSINRSLMRGSRHLYPIEMLKEFLTGKEVPRARTGVI